MRSRSGWRRVQLALNTANLAASLAFIAGAVWAWLGERGLPAPAFIVRLYDPMLAGLRWYGSEPVGAKVLATLSAVFAFLIMLACFLLSFKVHLEEIAVIILGIPFYLLITSICVLAAGLLAALVRLL